MVAWPSTLPHPDDDTYGWEEEPRVRVARFGDGYGQRSRDGLNHNPRKFEHTWTNLTTEQKELMLDFLRTRGGVSAFDWTPHEETDAILVKAPSWTTRRVSGGYWTVVVRFQQVFTSVSSLSADYPYLLFEDGMGRLWFEDGSGYLLLGG